MPPRIRTRVSKAHKENIGTGGKEKSKATTKAPRRALADKTNSASDDNSFEVPCKEKKSVIKSSNAQSKQITGFKDDKRPRRDRRVPCRFVENAVLTNFSSVKDNVAPRNATTNGDKAASVKSIKPTAKVASPDKSLLETSSIEPNLKAETSIVVSRPRRICRLPSRFNDHSISANKFIPLQPQNASTPIPQSKIKVPSVEKVNAKKENKKPENLTTVSLPTRSAKTTAINKILNNEISPDTNNNAKSISSKTRKAKSPSSKGLSTQRHTIKRYFNESATVSTLAAKKVHPRSINDATLKQVTNKIPEIRVLSCNKSSPGSEKNNQDIYEFTFDPDEEPKPQKKKRKKPAIKKAPKVTKPKAVVTHKTTYDQNISKALAALKEAVKHSKDKQPNLPRIQENIEPNNTPNISTHSNVNDTHKTPVHTGGYSSIRIEDIAADMEATVENDVDLNYSPVNSPHPKSSVNPIHEPTVEPETSVCNADPLNLQDNISFFDDIPVANSSMNTSVRHPLASPWRVEFNNLPIKWNVNAYVKPNMTPAVESSFICSEESNKKKHVYTNMVPEAIDPLPMITNSSSLKQPSIISYIKEITEKKALMKQKKYGSPSKITASQNSHMIGDSSRQVERNIVDNDLVTDNNTSVEVSSNNNELLDKENSKEKRNNRKRRNIENISDKLSKSPEKERNKDCTYFGFDESDDQENLSPVKVTQGRSRLRPRPVLQEMNGPARAVLPVAVKSKTTTSSEAVKKAFEGLRSAEDAPVFPENTQINMTNNDDLSLNDDSQSVHLFEDIEVVHHLKPTRKSYGNAKKLTFQQSTSASDSQDNAQPNDYSDNDDFGDLTFEIPNVKEKKKVKKKKPKKVMSKKEEKEAAEWAAGFNSMCEEIEEFPLVVE